MNYQKKRKDFTFVPNRRETYSIL